MAHNCLSIRTESRYTVLMILQELGPEAAEALPAVERLAREGDALEREAAGKALLAIRPEGKSGN